VVELGAASLARRGNESTCTEYRIYRLYLSSSHRMYTHVHPTLNINHRLLLRMYCVNIIVSISLYRYHCIDIIVSISLYRYHCINIQRSRRSSSHTACAFYTDSNLVRRSFVHPFTSPPTSDGQKAKASLPWIFSGVHPQSSPRSC
jgi:hypothetical protein